MESLVGAKNLAFCSNYNQYTFTFSKSTKELSNVEEQQKLSKHVTHFNPHSGLLYNNPGTPLPQHESIPYRLYGDAMDSFVGILDGTSKPTLRRQSLIKKKMHVQFIIHLIYWIKIGIIVVNS